VGDYNDTQYHHHGFLYDNGIFTPLDVLSAQSTQISNGTSSINNRGQIVGQYLPLTGHPYRTFLYDNGTFITLNFPGSTTTWGSAINNRGQIVGYYSGTSQPHAFLATPK
jgi:hypothetical protein